MRRAVLLLFAGACASGGDSSPRDTDPDAPDCTPQTFYRDVDADGHGDPAAPVEACEQPFDAVASNDDCDDDDARRHPGLPEICDGVDNDCNAATIESCPAGCTPQRRPPPDDLLRTYLFCNTSQSWAAAQATCDGAGYALVQIDDAAENQYLRNAATAAFGAIVFHIGGSDAATEGTWKWPGGDPFWQGGAGGMPLGNRYANWDPGEPNDDGTEDCAEMKPSGTWNDGSCGDAQRFVCRR